MGNPMGNPLGTPMPYTTYGLPNAHPNAHTDHRYNYNYKSTSLRSVNSENGCRTPCPSTGPKTRKTTTDRARAPRRPRIEGGMMTAVDVR
jgi:hypothetical protein